MSRGLLAAIVCGVVVACGCGTSTGKRAPLTAGTTPHPCGKAGRPPARYGHVVWIVMENKARGDVVGSAAAPYTTALARNCAQALSFRAETHPSLPNYIAMTSGSTHGIKDDRPPSSHPVAGPSIFGQLGRNWRALQESMPAPCSRASAGDYAVKHNPAAYFTALGAACRRQDVALGRTLDLSAKFTFVTPNMCNDTHDCSVATGDRWLQHFLGRVFASREYRAAKTAVFLTWDEDDSSNGNHIATIVATPAIRPGTASRTPFDHYSMLRTTEQMLGLAPIGGAVRARSMRVSLGI